MIMEITLSLCEDSGNNVCSNRKLCGLEYADRVLFLYKHPEKLQLIVNRLYNSVGMFELHFVPLQG